MEDTIKYIDDKYEGAAKYLHEVMSLPPEECWGPSTEKTAGPTVRYCMRTCRIGSFLLVLCKGRPEPPT